MAVSSVIFGISLLITIIGCNAAGEFTVLHSPESLKFSHSIQHQKSSSEGLLESTLKEIYSATLGLSVEENSEWNGLQIKDPFNTPEAVVEIYVDGVPSLGNAANQKNYPLIVDEYEPDTYKNVEHRIEHRFSNDGNKLVHINLADTDELTAYPDVFGDVKVPKVPKHSLQHLKYSVEEDYQFLYELEALKSITAKVQSGIIKPDNLVDFYYLRFSSLHPLSDYHGQNSLQTKEAKKLLSEALEELSAAFVKAYDGSVLVTSVTTDVVHTRRTVREVKAEELNSMKREVEDILLDSDDEIDSLFRDGRAGSKGEKDDAYSSDYAAIFNIILWFSVVFAFTLVAIVYALVDMDPGRDSIIYRMTSTRMKKDN